MKANSRLTPAIVLLLLAVVAESGAGGELARPGQNLADVTVGPYCGIDCVYAAARHYQRPISYASLVDSRFVGSRQGSSLGELARAAESAGLAAAPKAGFSIGELQSLQYPSILLLSRHRDAAAFHHWVLVLHAGSDSIQVMEAPGQSETITCAQLLAQWDGAALVIYPDEATKSTCDNWAFVQNGAMAVLAALIAVVTFARRKLAPPALAEPRPPFRAAVMRAALLLVLGIVAALFWHGFSVTGFCRNAEGLAIVKARFFSRQIPTVSRQELERLIANQEVVVVDSRWRKDFRAGHVPAAVNLPVDASPTAVQEFARGLPRGKAIVIYCQSDKCEFDEYVGSQLVFAGVKDVYSFQGGWRAWKEARPVAPLARDMSEADR